jgi:hypothetical protein
MLYEAIGEALDCYFSTARRPRQDAKLKRYRMPFSVSHAMHRNSSNKNQNPTSLRFENPHGILSRSMICELHAASEQCSQNCHNSVL